MSNDYNTWGTYGFWRPKVKKRKHPSFTGMETDLSATDEFDPLDPNRYQTSYNVPTMDIQANASRKINRGIYDDALRAEKGQQRRTKSIQDYNRFGYFVSLVTGNSFQPMSMTGASGAKTGTSTNKDVVRAEKAMLLNEWLKNPAKTKEQIIAFGNATNASPDGWEYIRTKLAPLWDLGDVVTFKRLNDDGIVEYARAYTNDVKSKEQLFSRGFREGGKTGVADDRKNKEVTDAYEVMEVWNQYLNDNELEITQEAVDGFYKKYPGLIAEPNKMAALNNYLQNQNLKPTFETFYNQKNPAAATKTARTDGQLFQELSKSEDWIAMSADNKWDKMRDEFKSNIFHATANSIREQVSNGDLDPSDFDIQKSEIEKALINGSTAWQYEFKPEDVGKVFSMLGSKSMQALGITAVGDSLLAGAQSDDPYAARDAAIQLMEGHGITMDTPGVKEMWDSFYRAHPNMGDIVTMPAQPVLTEGGNLVERPEQQYYRGSRGKLYPLGGEVQERKFKIMHKGLSPGTYSVIDENNEEKTYYTRVAMKDEVDNISKDIIGWMQKPEHYAETVQAYADIVETLSEATVTSGSLDRALGEIYKKLRDKSMVTNEEFDALRKDVGIYDSLKVWRESLGNGIKFTKKQRSQMLEIAYNWANSKAEKARQLVTNYELAFDVRYPPATSVIEAGYDPETMFAMGGLAIEEIKKQLEDYEKIIKARPDLFEQLKPEEVEVKTTLTVKEINDNAGIGVNAADLLKKRRPGRGVRLQ